MKKTISLFLLFFLAWAPSAPALAALVYLKDGSRLRGTVVGATARDVQFHTDQGTMRLAADQILRIDYAETEPSAQPAPSSTSQWDAQPWPERRSQEFKQVFFFDLGLASPLSRLDAASTGGQSAKNGGSGLRLGVGYLYELSPRLSAGMDFHYFHRGARDDFGLIPAGHARISGDTVAPLMVLKFTPADHGPIRPYILAGLGLNHTSTVVDATPLEGYSWSDTGTVETRRLIDDGQWGLASRAAVGVDFQSEEPGILSFEVGWLGVANKRHGGTPAGRDLGLDGTTGSLSALSATMRWGWKF
jgi:hypothetical protein